MIKHTIKKDKDFVQIPNSILTNPNISLKAKGVLALILSLPANWNFSIEGIVSKCKESKECIGNSIRELQNAGYIKRTMVHGNDGKMIRMEYEIFEEPYNVTGYEEQKEEKPCEDKPCTVNHSLEKPITENPSMDYPLAENPWVNNTKSNKKRK